MAVSGAGNAFAFALPCPSMRGPACRRRTDRYPPNARLPLAYRETLWLCDAMGLTYVEAGAILGCDPGTIGSRISRGRKALREHFSRNGHEVR